MNILEAVATKKRIFRAEEPHVQHETAYPDNCWESSLTPYDLTADDWEVVTTKTYATSVSREELDEACSQFRQITPAMVDQIAHKLGFRTID
jgi:hypothetical protein